MILERDLEDKTDISLRLPLSSLFFSFPPGLLYFLPQPPGVILTLCPIYILTEPCTTLNISVAGYALFLNKFISLKTKSTQWVVARHTAVVSWFIHQWKRRKKKPHSGRPLTNLPKKKKISHYSGSPRVENFRENGWRRALWREGFTEQTEPTEGNNRGRQFLSLRSTCSGNDSDTRVDSSTNQ